VKANFQKVNCICFLDCSPCTFPLNLYLFLIISTYTALLDFLFDFGVLAPYQDLYEDTFRFIVEFVQVDHRTLNLPRADGSKVLLSDI
jgi:hypothetical protein